MKKLITLFALLSFGAVQAQTVALKINLEAGQKYTVQITNTSDISQSVAGQDIKVTSDVLVTNTYEVLEKKDDQWIIAGRYTKVFSESVAPTGKITFGSELSDDVSLAIKALINKPYTLTLSANGKVSKVEGLDEIFDSMDADLGSMSKSRKKRAIEQVKSGFGEQQSKSFLESCFMKYPERELKAGHVWMIRDTTDVNGSRAFSDGQYKLDEFDAESARLMMTGTVETDPANPAIVTNGAEVKTRLWGSSTAKYVVDIQSGLATSVEGTNSFSGNMEYSMGGNSMEIPIKIVTKATVKANRE